MKKFLFLFLVTMGLVLNARGQCAFDNSFYVNLTPAGPGMSASDGCCWGGDLITVNVVAGESYTISTCGGGAWDSQITLYDAPGTTVLGYSDDFCGLQSEITWVATYTGVLNVVLDQFFCSSNTSCMQMTVTWNGPPPPPPANDECINAIPLCGATVNGSTALATPNAGAEPACFAGWNSNSVWYSVVGTGAPMTVSLCASAFDTYLSVYSGTCGALTCISGNDDFCGLSSELTFASTAGTTYYILVKGYGTGNGNYTLNVAVPAVANDDCINATGILPGTPVSGTTNCSMVDAVPLCGTASAPTSGGVWYSYTPGCSGSLTASLCSGTSFNTQLSVFDGTCGALNCISGNDDFCATQSEVNWSGVAGTTYYILVHGSGSQTGIFDLLLTQVDLVAPVADVSPLPDVTGDCEVTATPPTATDNCVGTVTGTTTDPITYSVPGTYPITWTYDDGNGNTSTQTQNVVVNPDTIDPVITCMNDTTLNNTADSCGAIFTFTMPVATDNCSQPYTGTDAYYIRSNSGFGEPWGATNNTTAMDAVFGAGVWFGEFFETCTPATVFSTSTKFVFLEGSDAHADELNIFLQTNLPLIETYVNNGGTIFINAAPNEGGNIDFGFGGTTLNYSYPVTACASVNAVTPTDPIFNGPFLPVGTAFTGTDFAHSHVTGTGLTDMITGCGFAQFTAKQWGDGLAAFGSMTMPQFHSPLPEAQNLRQNIISWVSSTVTGTGPSVVQTTGLPSGSLFPVGTTTNTFVATDAVGNTSSCSFDVVVIDNELPVPSIDSSAAYTFVATDLPILCPDFATTLDSINVTGVPTVLNSGDIASVCIDIDHTFDADMTISLISPQGTILILSDANGGAGDDYIQTCFDMNAPTNITSGAAPFIGSYIPEGPGGFDAFNGEDPNGYWKLAIFDAFGGDQGVLYDFKINFDFHWENTLPVLQGECMNVVSPTANDNCSGTLTATTSDPTSFTADGTYTINWTYTDGAGNTMVQSQEVIVDDVTDPVPDVANLPTISADCIVSKITAPSATDACTGAITGTTTDPITYNVAGTYTITWAYDDGNGNIFTQDQTIIVTDSINPVPDQAILPNVTGNCTVTVSTVPTATDNCAGTINGTTNDPLFYNVVGTHLIVWIYDDGNGNTWTQNQIVVVDPCLGIEGETSDWNALLYPNPGNGIFTLSLSEMPVERTEIRLVNSLGQVLYTGVLQSQVQQFDFSYLASATYYLLIHNAQGQISKPLIINDKN